MVTSDEKWFEKKLGFNRGVLRKSEKFIERDFSGVNPRELLRKTRRKIQDLSRDEDKFKFEVKKDPVEVSKEDVGSATGYVRGGLKAHFERPDHDGGIVQYKPYFQKGKYAFITGLFALGTSYGMTQLENPPEYTTYGALLGLLLMAGGTYGLFYKEHETFNVKIVSKLRSTILGEVTEKKVEEEDKTHTEVEGNVSMIFAADTDIELLSDKKYRRVLDKRDIKNTEALADKIDEKRDEIHREIYLDQYQDIEEPLPEKEVNKKSWRELEKRLKDNFSEGQLNRWLTEKLIEKEIVEEHVVETLEEDVKVAKNEATDLAEEIQDHVS